MGEATGTGKNEAFDAWVESLQTKQTRCQTCLLNDSDINSAIDKYLALDPLPPVRKFWSLLRASFGYTLGETTFKRHLTNCLGVTLRG